MTDEQMKEALAAILGMSADSIDGLLLTLGIEISEIAIPEQE